MAVGDPAEGNTRAQKASEKRERREGEAGSGGWEPGLTKEKRVKFGRWEPIHSGYKGPMSTQIEGQKTELAYERLHALRCYDTYAEPSLLKSAV